MMVVVSSRRTSLYAFPIRPALYRPAPLSKAKDLNNACYCTGVRPEARMSKSKAEDDGGDGERKRRTEVPSGWWQSEW
jgi:hypothetical protein